MKSSQQSNCAYLARILGGILVVASMATAAEPTPPDHLFWAEDIALNVLPENNAYATQPSYISWPGVDGNDKYVNHTLCASFVTRVLQQAYGWSDAYFRTWMASTSPNAIRYHDTIMQQNGFVAIDNIADIQPGDIIAIKYPSGSNYTGHTMIVMSPAVIRNATAPKVPDTYQYEVKVIDSSETGHGPTDTRKQADGTYDSGAGAGIFRIFADVTGLIKGYTWSTYSNSVYYDQNTRHLIVGRLL